MHFRSGEQPVLAWALYLWTVWLSAWRRQRVSDSFCSDWCHLEVPRFKPITLGVGLPARQRKACLPKHIHSLIKTAKGEDQRRSEKFLNFMQISMLRLKLTQTAINIPTVPRGTTSQARCCSSTHFSFPIKKALENPAATHCLSACIFTTWHPFPEEGVTSTCLQKMVQNRLCFACLSEEHRGALCLQPETFYCHPFKSECSRYAGTWVNTASLPAKLSCSSSLLNFSYTMTVGGTIQYQR